MTDILQGNLNERQTRRKYLLLSHKPLFSYKIDFSTELIKSFERRFKFASKNWKVFFSPIRPFYFSSTLVLHLYIQSRAKTLSDHFKNCQVKNEQINAIESASLFIRTCSRHSSFECSNKILVTLFDKGCHNGNPKVISN